MSPPHHPSPSDSVKPFGAHPPLAAPSRSMDPWVAAGRLGGGVLLYGGIGWLLDQWWDTVFLAPVGIVLGACLGLYVTFFALRAR